MDWEGNVSPNSSSSEFVPPLAEDNSKNIIPVYCSILAAVVVGLLAYVAFKWYVCLPWELLDLTHGLQVCKTGLLLGIADFSAGKQKRLSCVRCGCVDAAVDRRARVHVRVQTHTFMGRAMGPSPASPFRPPAVSGSLLGPGS